MIETGGTCELSKANSLVHYELDVWQAPTCHCHGGAQRMLCQNNSSLLVRSGKTVPSSSQKPRGCEFLRVTGFSDDSVTHLLHFRDRALVPDQVLCSKNGREVGRIAHVD